MSNRYNKDSYYSVFMDQVDQGPEGRYTPTPKASLVPLRKHYYNNWKIRELPGWKGSASSKNLELFPKIFKPYTVNHRSELTMQPRYPHDDYLPFIQTSSSHQRIQIKKLVEKLMAGGKMKSMEYLIYNDKLPMDAIRKIIEQCPSKETEFLQYIYSQEKAALSGRNPQANEFVKAFNSLMASMNNDESIFKEGTAEDAEKIQSFLDKLGAEELAEIKEKFSKELEKFDKMGNIGKSDRNNRSERHEKSERSERSRRSDRYRKLDKSDRLDRTNQGSKDPSRSKRRKRDSKRRENTSNDYDDSDEFSDGSEYDIDGNRKSSTVMASRHTDGRNSIQKHRRRRRKQKDTNNSQNSSVAQRKSPKKHRNSPDKRRVRRKHTGRSDDEPDEEDPENTHFKSKRARKSPKKGKKRHITSNSPDKIRDDSEYSDSDSSEDSSDHSDSSDNSEDSDYSSEDENSSNSSYMMSLGVIKSNGKDEDGHRIRKVKRKNRKKNSRHRTKFDNESNSPRKSINNGTVRNRRKKETTMKHDRSSIASRSKNKGKKKTEFMNSKKGWNLLKSSRNNNSKLSKSNRRSPNKQSRKTKKSATKRIKKKLNILMALTETNYKQITDDFSSKKLSLLEIYLISFCSRYINLNNDYALQNSITSDSSSDESERPTRKNNYRSDMANMLRDGDPSHPRKFDSRYQYDSNNKETDSKRRMKKEERYFEEMVKNSTNNQDFKSSGNPDTPTKRGSNAQGKDRKSKNTEHSKKRKHQKRRDRQAGRTDRHSGDHRGVKQSSSIPIEDLNNPLHRFYHNFATSLYKKVALLLVNIKINKKLIAPKYVPKVYRRMIKLQIIKGKHPQRQGSSIRPDWQNDYYRNHRSHSNFKHASRSKLLDSKSSIDFQIRKPSITKRSEDASGSDEEYSDSDDKYVKMMQQYQHFRMSLNYEMKHIEFMSELFKGIQLAETKYSFSDYSDSEESVLEGEDVGSQLASIFNGRNFAFKDDKFKDLMNFQAAVGQDMINTNSNDEDGVASYIDRDNLEAFMRKKRFFELRQFLQNEERNRHDLLVIDEWELNPEELRTNKRNCLITKIRREKALRKRGNVPITNLGGKPSLTFSNLKRELVISKIKKMLLKRQIEVDLDQERQERIYCRLKGMHKLGDYSYNSRLMISVENALRELREVHTEC